jgi:hypothetical protein
MRRRDFLDGIVLPLAAGFPESERQWLFRTYSGHVDRADPLRQQWKRLCPNTHLWLEAVAAESMPQAGLLAWFRSVEVCREVLPDTSEVFEGWPGSLAGCKILELCDAIRATSLISKRALRNSQFVLTGFHSLAERWRIRDGEIGRLALFRAEPG